MLPLPAGKTAIRSGLLLSQSDSLRVTLLGSGCHGSSPETTVDPVVIAAATVMRLQTVVSRMVDEGSIETTIAEHYGRIDATNLKRAHALIESGRSIGKIVLEGF